MKFTSPLIKASLVKRYKRFLADIKFEDGAEITVHCPNPGSMMGLVEPGSTVWVSKSDNPKRKLSHTLELIKLRDASGTIVGINTNLANRICEEAITSRKFAIFGEFGELRREVKYGDSSRIDILLSSNNEAGRLNTNNTYIEVKSVTLQRQRGLHEFPDGVTARGRKHLDELAKVVKAGNRAIMLYLVQREDGERLSFARDIDPAYAQAFDVAVAQGVEAYAIQCKINPEEIVADKMIEIDEPVIRQMK
jgi:sugar fermentation stimulation protein A